MKIERSHKKRNKKKVVVTGDSMLNGISEKGFSMSHKVIFENSPGGTSNTITEKLDQLLQQNPDDLIIHVETNDLKNHVKLLKQVKQVSREAPSTNPAFSSIIVRKNKQKLDKSSSETKAHLKIVFLLTIKM